MQFRPIRTGRIEAKRRNRAKSLLLAHVPGGRPRFVLLSAAEGEDKLLGHSTIFNIADVVLTKMDIAKARQGMKAAAAMPEGYIVQNSHVTPIEAGR